MSDAKERRNEAVVRRIAAGEKSRTVAKRFGITQTRVRQIFRAAAAKKAPAK